MELYQALQAVLHKVQVNNERVRAVGNDHDTLRNIMDNQERLGEGILLLGGMLQAMLEREISVQLIPDKGESLQ